MQSFRYASGPFRTAEHIPASAFSIGDLLMLDSTSSVSRINVLLASGTDWYGVALSSSLQSVNNKVAVLIPEGDTHLWVSLNTAYGSAVTPGIVGDILFSTANGRQYFDPSSTNSSRVAVVEGTAAVSQSVESKVIVRLMKVADASNFGEF